jgi:hypothetical protein
MQRSVSEIALQVAAKITWHPLKRSYIHINQGSFSCNLRRYFPHSYLESGRRKILHLHFFHFSIVICISGIEKISVESRMQAMLKFLSIWPNQGRLEPSMVL